MPEQLKDPHSFLSQVKGLIKVRLDSNIALGKSVSLIETGNNGVTAVLYQLPSLSFQLTVINWGLNGAKVSLNISQVSNKNAIDLVSKETVGKVSQEGVLEVSLEVWQGKTITFE